ncbi:MAG: oligosaccharide flippase family protein [Desulfatiglandaceae bacterium]
MPLFYKNPLVSQWAATIYTGGISLGLTFVIARILGPVGFGSYSYILTIASLFLILQDGGYKTLLFREKTLPSEWLRPQEDKLFSWALGHTIVISMAGILFVWAVECKYHQGIFAALICFGLQAGVNFVSSVLRGRGLFAREALWQVTVRTLSAAAILGVLFFTEARPFVIFAGWAVGLLASLFMSPIKWARPLFGGFGQRGVRRACLGFLVIDAATTVYYRSDIILLEHLSTGSAVVGQYAAAYRFLDGIILFAAPLGLIWFRKLRLVYEDRVHFRSQLKGMILIMGLVACTLILTGVFFNHQIVSLTFGQGYHDAAMLLPWLFSALIFVLPNGVLTHSAIAQNMERLYAIAAGGGAGLNIGLNLILIPGYGALGAAWATIATEAFLTAILVIGLKQKLTGERT